MSRRINGVQFGGAKTTPIRRSSGGGKPPKSGCLLAALALAALPTLPTVIGALT